MIAQTNRLRSRLSLLPLRSLRTAYSYRSKFKTKKNEWIDVRLPLSDFEATWFGRTLPNQKLDPTKVSGLGILLGDKKAGPFKLEVDWIRAVSSSE